MFKTTTIMHQPQQMLQLKIVLHHGMLSKIKDVYENLKTTTYTNESKLNELKMLVAIRHAIRLHISINTVLDKFQTKENESRKFFFNRVIDTFTFNVSNMKITIVWDKLQNVASELSCN